MQWALSSGAILLCCICTAGLFRVWPCIKQEIFGDNLISRIRKGDILILQTFFANLFHISDKKIYILKKRKFPVILANEVQGGLLETSLERATIPIHKQCFLFVRIQFPNSNFAKIIHKKPIINSNSVASNFPRTWTQTVMGSWLKPVSRTIFRAGF